MESQLRREMGKMKKNLDGIRRMDKLPGAMVIIDVKHEVTAIREARKLGIPLIALIDTDGNPEMADIAIPGNDDSMRSIDVVVRELCLAIADGKNQREVTRESQPAAPQGGEGDRQSDQPRRSTRSQFRKDDSKAPAQA